ncbi:MAG: exonuclease SbcCD subunit D C-terminal domain-containing protein [Pseudomonadota bacterium]|nr:exonuclease SbcCD subunit D C-terminal domain-containing protein [Pseudomonadota bacterium]
MKILHTSDWHLGRSLYGRKRYDESLAFLNWLADLIVSEGVDVLLVAGDIFDTSTPSNRAQELYYRFLCRVSASCCRHIVIIAGNHDSPSFLNAPKELLRTLNVYVIGSISENPEAEVITLSEPNNIAQAIVCAVPYLRDRDIRTVEAGEAVTDKNIKLIKGVQKHYAEVCRVAEKKQAEYGEIPIIGMGHLFTTGGKTIDGDGVRELYVGSLAHVGKDIFPECIDYLALGHLHIPQKVGKSEHIRYCGSPIPMGYGEATQEKSVVLVKFDGRTPQINEHPIPCFQVLERISGGIDKISARIDLLKSGSSNAWLEIEYTGREIVGNLQELMDEAIADTDMEIRKIKNRRVIERILNQSDKAETLDDLNKNDVFIRCLDSHEVAEKERPELIRSYQEIINILQEEDSNEE